MNQQRQQQDNFRFSSRSQYEQEMIKMIKKSELEEEYEELLEEYLKFCEKQKEENV